MEDRGKPGPSGCSKPLHVQRAEKALDLSLLLQERREELDTSDDDEDISQAIAQGHDFLNGKLQ